MKVAIIGASGKTGTILVHEALRRGHQVVAVCRPSSAVRLEKFSNNDACKVVTAPVVSDKAILAKALVGCDAVIAISISVRHLKATDLVLSLAEATAANGVKRLVFTAGEVTVAPAQGDVFTLRQRIMSRVFPIISFFTPFSMADMIRASLLIRQQPGWDWTIVRAPTLNDTSRTGYRLCEIHEVTARHTLSRGEDRKSVV